MELLPTIAFQLKNTTCYDPVLCKVLKHVRKGLAKYHTHLKLYYD